MVFISYSHDSEEHKAGVLKLAARLRTDGFDLVIDQEEAPLSGWRQWALEQIERAQYVLMVCTETYRRRAEGKEKPGEGRGASYEARLIHEELYEASGRNSKYILVGLSRSDCEHRPKGMRDYPCFAVDDDAEYERLLKALGGRPPKGRVPTWTVPAWTIPARNEYFSGRDDFLEALHNLTAPVRAIQGLGGLGKTQTAIEFAYRYRGEYTAGFWMTADSRDALVSGFAALGDKEEQDLAKAARGALRWFEENSGWLLILDNVDDWSVVKEWLPAGRRGLVLITTRLQSTGIIAKGLDLPKMTPVEGAEFLLRRSKIENPSEADREAARRIAEEVGGLPLALDQAGAYMEEMPASAAEYLEFYGAKLRARRGEASDHDSVTVTFTLAFEKLGERVKDIVRMCAFLAPDAIPEEILPGDKEPRLEAVREAGRFSLIQRNVADKSIEIHRLVQDVVKDGMDDATRRSWAERVLEAVNAVLPTEIEFRTWPQCERLLPHAQAAAVLAGKFGLESRSVARLLNQTGFYLWARAEFQEAEPLYQSALAIGEKIFGPDHPDTATSLNNLALLYVNQGRYQEAELRSQRALAIREKTLGATSLDTARSLNNLATIYRHLGRYKEAEPLSLRALAIREERLGPSHPDNAKVLNNLAEIYREQGRCQEAEPLFHRTLTIREKALGPDHPDTAASLNNLAVLYDEQGRYEEAEPVSRRALAIVEKAYGLVHPATLLYVKNYAIMLRHLGREDEARALETRYKLKP